MPYFANEIGKLNLKYFLELFGHEGENSILSFLKAEGLATFLQVSKHSVALCMTKYELNIELTKKGLENYVRVVEVVFQYANLLKASGPCINLCNELNCLGKLRYDYPDRSNPLKSCIKFAEKLHKMPEKDVS